jgi:hypothetical protein
MRVSASSSMRRGASGEGGRDEPKEVGSREDKLGDGGAEDVQGRVGGKESYMKSIIESTKI